MDEVDAGQSGVPPVTSPKTAGETLRAEREAQGLGIADVTARTRVPLRHLEAIEAGDYQSLPSPTYAVGFARAYARAIGADDVAIARLVRAEVDRLGRRQPEYTPYVVADPARVPSRGLAIVAAGLALGLAVLAALWFGGDWLRTSAAGTEAAAPVTASRPAPVPSPAAAVPTGGEVVLTAQDEVWMRVYDADDSTLYIGTMKPGERYIVPAAAKDPRINVGRPDKLAVTLNGSALPPLGTGERPIKDVRVGGPAIAARLAGAPAPIPDAPTPSTTAAATTGALPPAFAAPAPAVVTPGVAPARSSASPVRSSAGVRPVRPQRPRVLSETQRANLESARDVRRQGRSDGRP